ncbi:phage antirepressor KilAC domain-containing protein [Microbacterium sp.]|uniref:phage antirepressor KilAC domain-containing protein n=1 Tax=Microbacterium sp. TaxID=51671 RepID=UPI003F723230
MVELAPTRQLIPRWLGHGNLHILVERDRVFVRADQVEQLAGIPPWGRGEQLLDDDWFEHAGNPYYPLEDAVSRCEFEGTATAAAFLEWLSDTVDELLIDEVLDQAQHIPGFIGSHPVRRAAELLDADPAISIGRTSLFAHMHHIGWIDREAGDWQMTTLARRNGWLTLRDVTIPAANRQRRRTYPQIYVTPAGLAELRRTLHALNTHAPVPATTQATLFD